MFPPLSEHAYSKPKTTHKRQGLEESYNLCTVSYQEARNACDCFYVYHKQNIDLCLNDLTSGNFT